ncbi:MAG: hypothetical protein QG568_584 [Patescibacteria group bacterium]|nr:hypothetical protein [Patescibacteria group bacterium]
MIDDPRKYMHSGNVCFIVLATDDDSATVKITDHCWMTDYRLVGSTFNIGIKFPRAYVRNGTEGPGFKYVLKGITSKLEREDKVNACIRYGDNLKHIEVISITPEHELRNLLSQPKKGQSTSPTMTEVLEPINPPGAAFDKATSATTGGTSDGGDGSDVDPVSDDLRTTQRKVARAPRPGKKKDTTAAA